MNDPKQLPYVAALVITGACIIYAALGLWLAIQYGVDFIALLFFGAVTFWGAYWLTNR